MSAAVVTLPVNLGARATARSLVRGAVQPGTTDVAVNAFETRNVAQGAADEIVEQLLDLNVQRVLVLNAPNKFEEHLRAAHRRRTSPGEHTFLLQFQTRSEDAFLRAV